MRITIELPDDLLRRIKVQAALTDQKLNVLVPALLESGLSQSSPMMSPGAKPKASFRQSQAKKSTPRRRA